MESGQSLTQKLALPESITVFTGLASTEEPNVKFAVTLELAP
jgi:hypothetical protein